jgi:hypothetical protein
MPAQRVTSVLENKERMSFGNKLSNINSNRKWMSYLEVYLVVQGQYESFCNLSISQISAGRNHRC